MNKWETQYRSQGLRQLSALHSDIQTPNFGPALGSTLYSAPRPSPERRRTARPAATRRPGAPDVAWSYSQA